MGLVVVADLGLAELSRVETQMEDLRRTRDILAGLVRDYAVDQR